MLRKSIRSLCLAAALAAGVQGVGSRAAQAAGPSDLFANYYVGPPGLPAQLYVSPLPVPPLVGHTWITYQPLDPHEFLYCHSRTYYAHHPGAASTTTKIRWCHSILCK